MASNRISPEEANARVLAGEPVVFLDARRADAWERSDRKIPGAVRAPADDIDSHLSEIDRQATVITYCTCPRESSSVQAARHLIRRGYPRVFVLRGGFDAWIAAEYPVEEKLKAA